MKPSMKLYEILSQNIEEKEEGKKKNKFWNIDSPHCKVPTMHIAGAYYTHCR